MAIITLLTDFGDQDAYIGAVKGVIYSRCPQAQVADISHHIAPGDIRSAAFVLANTAPFFPIGSVHIAVVDPSVGTARKLLAVRTPFYTLLAPDNGILTMVLKGHIREYRRQDSQTIAILEDDVLAVEISNSHLFCDKVSSTFHARDILAPVAAQIATGLDIKQLGPSVTSICAISISVPNCLKYGVWQGEIIYIDRFGNLISNIEENMLPKDAKLQVQINDHVIDGLNRTYADKDNLLALISSSGYLEIAINQGSASKKLSVTVGQKITVHIL
ncbi:MAG: SAM-dependent chlorinase/fluorinase [Chloroflexi bacterium]|nr:SAM-dependent chlorinase/fluorinase [Chloroflexota bacterium]